MSVEAKEYLKQSLKTLLYEIMNAQHRNEHDAFEAYYEEVKEFQKKAKALYPDNPHIQELPDEILVSEYRHTSGTGRYMARLTTVKLRLERILAALGITVEDIHRVSTGAPMVNVSQMQSQMTYNFQSIDQIIANLNNFGLDVTTRANIEKNLIEFKKESEKAAPDKNRLKKIAEDVWGMKKEIGVMLFGFLLDKGWIVLQALSGAGG